MDRRSKKEEWGEDPTYLKRKLFRSTENWVPDGVIPHLCWWQGWPCA